MKYAAIPHTKAARAKITRVLREYRHHRLYTPSGRRVTNKRQAVAIALSEARHMRRNPLTKMETRYVVKAARRQLSLARRPKSLTAPEMHDPRARAAARAYHYGFADALAATTNVFGTKKKHGKGKGRFRTFGHSFRSAMNPRRHRRNPEGHGHGKMLAFGLIGLGLLLYLRQSQTVTQPIPQQPGGILGPISGVLGNLGSSSWFQNLWVTAPSATAGEWTGTWPDTQATPILGSEIQGP